MALLDVQSLGIPEPLLTLLAPRGMALSAVFTWQALTLPIMAQLKHKEISSGEQG